MGVVKTMWYRGLFDAQKEFLVGLGLTQIPLCGLNVDDADFSYTRYR